MDRKTNLQSTSHRAMFFLPRASQLLLGIVTGVFGLTTFASLPARASLTGDEIFCSVVNIFPPNAPPSPNLFDIPGNKINPDQPTPVVGDGIECGFEGGALLTADFSDSDSYNSTLEIVLDSLLPSPMDVGELNFDFEDLDWVDYPDGEIIGFELVENTFPVVNSFSFGSDSLFVSLFAEEIGASETFSATFDIITNHKVPEPSSTLALLTLATLGTGSALYKKSKQKRGFDLDFGSKGKV